MFVSEAILAILPLVHLAQGVPAPFAHKKGAAFTVNQVPSGKFKLRSGPNEVRRTHLKYGKPAPFEIEMTSVANSGSSGTQGSVSAVPEQYDQAYLCPVSVGTPAQSLNMDFDTGSSDLWVFSSEMPSSESSGHEIYTPSDSSTSSLESGESWQISYGDGSSAGGNIYTDTVTIGGVTSTSQAVEAAESAASEFVQDTSNDGLVGLAFDSINTATPNKVSTFMDNVASSLASPLFAAYLVHGSPGAYDFGFIDSSKYSGSIDYVSVNTANGFWEFTADGYAVGSSSTSSSLDCIADTGTSLVYLPDSVVSAYYGQVSGAESTSSGYVFDCSASLPDLSIIINGNLHTIPGSYLNYSPQGSQCFGGLQSSDGIGFNILGDVFLKSQYVIFDYGSTQLGFAAQA